MAINQQDFITPITGNIVIQNNGARLVLQANADLNTLFEGDESFKLLLRKGSAIGPVVATTSVVIVRDTSNTITYNSLIESADTVAEGGTVSITLDTTNLGPNNTLYYTTTGNAASSLFAAGNTGSFVTTGNSYTLALSTTSSIPDSETRFFRLEIREGSLSGPVKITSNVINVVDSQQAFIIATGGFLTIEDGYKIHHFTSSNTFTISGLGIPTNRTLEYLIVAGGGAGGRDGDERAGGGGGGGLLLGNLVLTIPRVGTSSIVVGGGGAPAPSPQYQGNRGSPSSIFSNTIIAIGGGGSDYNVGEPGGSGGGAGWAGPAGNSTAGQGNPGGPGSGWGGGGGGGAGEQGGPYKPNPGASISGGYGHGGNGLPISWLTPAYGTSGPAPGRWFSGGGGAGNYYNRGGGAPGGAGGGGRGGMSPDGAGGPGGPYYGVINTGGGSGQTRQPAGTFGGSGIVVVRYPYTVKTFNLNDDTSNTFIPGSIVQGSNITYTLTTVNVSNNTPLYYTTSGNVTTSDFFGGNTGSFTVVRANATFSISIANNIVTGGATKVFTLQLREGSTTGPVVASANTVTVYSQDSNNFIQATGGTIIDSSGYRLHVFTSTNNFNVSSVGKFNKVDYLIIAGGGGGASAAPSTGGGGGGAGGLLLGNTALSVANYLANVGAGGTTATRGGNSDIFNFISIGGGGSAELFSPPGAPTAIGFGGSGAGASKDCIAGSISTLGGLGVSGQGNPGGTNSGRSPGYGTGAGGGGAGEAGVGSQVPNAGMRGGNGRPISWIPASYGTTGPAPGRWFAGGGGAGGGSSGTFPQVVNTAASGGAGGGGPGGTGTPGGSLGGFAGNVNTGSAGGGGGANGGGGGTGGSGIIVIRYIKP